MKDINKRVKKVIKDNNFFKRKEPAIRISGRVEITISFGDGDDTRAQKRDTELRSEGK